MTEIYYVDYVAYNTAQRNEFEFLEKAIKFSEDMKEAGFEQIQVHDQADPRIINDNGEVEAKEPVYTPGP